MSNSTTANTRGVQQVFDAYQRSRATFAQQINEFASNAKNAPILANCGALALLRPLLLDTVPSVQHNAAQALGRLASHSAEISEQIIDADILPQLVYSLNSQNRFYKKAAAFVLRSVSKHSAHHAECVVRAGAGDALVQCLDEFDPDVKETAAWAIGYIARHTAELAQAMVDAGAVPLLVLCVQEPELSLKRIAASALSDISKHTPDLAQSVVDANAIVYLSPLMNSKDAKLKRQILSALAQIAKHSVELAELVVASDIFPGVLERLKDPDLYVQKNAATLLRELCKHSPELARLVVNSGGVAFLVDYIHDCDELSALPGIMALGFIAACSETLAWTIIAAKGVEPLAHALDSLTPPVLAGSAWALGQLGRHTPEHAQACADANVLVRLLRLCVQNSHKEKPNLLSDTSSLSAQEQQSEDIRKKAKRALKAIVQKCTNVSALVPLIDSPQSIQIAVLRSCSRILRADTVARKDFASSGALAKCTALLVENSGEKDEYTSSALTEAVRGVTQCFPEDVVRYYSPTHANTLLERIEQYDPAQKF